MVDMFLMKNNLCRHPDKNPSEEAEAKFIEVSKAYEVGLFTDLQL